MLPFNVSSNKKILVTLLCIFIVMFTFNCMTPLVADDFNYSFSWATDQRITSFSDILPSLEVHRDYTNGRVFSHGFAFLFLLLPKLIFNVINAFNAVVIACIYIHICRLFVSDCNKAFPIAVFSLLMLWNFTPAFGQIFLWLDGACNYSWAITFLLVFLIPFISEYFDRSYKPNIPVAIIMVFEAFVAGAYSESGSISSIFIAICLLVLMLIFKKKFSGLLWCNLLSACLGFVYMMWAPSMKLGHRGKFSLSAVADIINSIFSAIYSVMETVGITIILAELALIIVAVLILFFVRKNKKLFFGLLFADIFAGYLFLFAVAVVPDLLAVSSVKQIIEVLLSSTIFNVLTMCMVFFTLLLLNIYHKTDIKSFLFTVVLFFGALGSVAAFIFASYIPARGFVYFSSYICIACAYLVWQLYKKMHIRIPQVLSVILVTIFILSFCLGTADIISIHNQASYRDDLIKAAQSEAETVVELPSYTPSTKFSAAYGLADINDDPNQWPNGAIALYYGFNQVYRALE